MGFGTRTCKLKMVLSGYKPSDASLTRVRENFFFEKVFWCRKRCTSYRRKDRILPTSRDNNVSDEGFQYFFYTVIRDSRDLILSKSRGVELTFKNSLALVFHLVQGPRKSAQDVRDPKHFKSSFLRQPQCESHLLLPDHNRLFHGVDGRILGQTRPRLQFTYLLPLP